MICKGLVIPKQDIPFIKKALNHSTGSKLLRFIHSGNPVLSRSSNKRKGKICHDITKIQAALSKAHSPNGKRNKKLPKLPLIGNPRILKTVFTHKLATSDPEYDVPECYERLELIGDSVLTCLVTEIMLERFPSMTEGVIVRPYKNILLCNRTLAEFSMLYGLPIHILPKQLKVGNKMKIYADVFEAYIGGLHLGSTKKQPSSNRIKEWLKCFLNPKIDEIQSQGKIEYLASGSEFSTNDKSKAPTSNVLPPWHLYNEYSRFAKDKLYSKLCPYFIPSYEIIEVNKQFGDHSLIFKAACIINGEVLSAESSTSLKQAKNNAALSAMSYNKKKLEYYENLNKKFLSEKGAIVDVVPIKTSVPDQLRKLGYLPIIDPVEKKNVQLQNK